jgi:hypothetical protein
VATVPLRICICDSGATGHLVLLIDDADQIKLHLAEQENEVPNNSDFFFEGRGVSKDPEAASLPHLSVTQLQRGPPKK